MLGKPGLWPALVLNTVLRKPCGQLPLAGIRELELTDVPDVPDPPEVEPDGGLLGPGLLALVDDGREGGEYRFSPALAGGRAAFPPVAEDDVPFPEGNLHGDALLPAATRKTRQMIDRIMV